MVRHMNGETFDHPGIPSVTGNSFIREEGTLVMSMCGGLALEKHAPYVTGSAGIWRKK